LNVICGSVHPPWEQVYIMSNLEKPEGEDAAWGGSPHAGKPTAKRDF